MKVHVAGSMSVKFCLDTNARIMHTSFFEYNLSRPYPLWWFTPVVILLGLIATVIFSLLNYVASSYTLVGRYTSDPNATVTETHLHWPNFLASKLQPTCESTRIAVNTKILTNNSALTYTLTDVLQNVGEAGQTFSPALVYPNSVLPDCTVTSVSLQLSSLARTAAQIALTDWGVVAQAFITCRLDTENQRVTVFNLTADYDLMPPTVSIYSNFYNFIGRNETSKASLYWGESLLSFYWLKLSHDVDNVGIRSGNQTATSGTLVYTINGSTTDITNDSFFSVQWRFIVPNTDNTHMVYVGDSMPNFSDDESRTNVGPSADVLAKSLYSTVLTDLGQHGAFANILTDPKLLEHFTSNFTTLMAEDSRGGPANTSYVPRPDSSPLGLSPSVFEAIYLCQIPQRKSIGPTFLAILIADLVFLQAVWTLWKLAIGTYMKRVDPQTSFCEGCCRTTHTQASADIDRYSQFPLLQQHGHSGYKMMPVTTHMDYGH